MSREERRAYQRLNKKVDPYALPSNPALRARQEKIRAKRAMKPAPRTRAGLTTRALVWIFGGGLAAGFVAFSLAWPSGMPFAAYVGAAGAVAWIGLAFGLRLLGRRTPPAR
jgi:hypothetical protein